jgi:hypothetical protein
MRRSNPAFVGLLVGIALGSGHAGAASGSHQDAIREYLIVKHCGLETEEVRAGFRVEVITLVGDGEISAAEARADRNAAAEHVRRHWRNRGMGPADPRCLSEGRAAVCHFLAVVGIATGSDCSQQRADQQ